MSDLAIQNNLQRPPMTGPAKKSSSTDEDRKLKELKQRDVQVKSHEQAHLAASGGAAASGAKYTYEKGSDGSRYAVGGEVDIKIQSGKTPDETLRNAQHVERAALAPADPSTQDLQVAARASRMETQARSEMAKQNQPDNQPTSKPKQAYSFGSVSPFGSVDVTA